MSALFDGAEKEKREPLVVLVDGSSLAYRAYFAFEKNPLRNSRGENTSAVFAFTQSLLKILRDYRPEYGAVVFDAKGPTFRHQLLETYKAQRPPMPTDLARQMEYIRQVAQGLGFQVLELPGYEADDVMAYLAQKAARKGYRVLLVTSDKDLLQLVNDRIHVLDTRPKQEVYYTREEVIRHKGVPPERIPDLLALEGDAIDNIPGVPGVGPKTARQLLEEFGSVENLVQNADKIRKKSLRELLSNPQVAQQVLDYKRLATLETDLPLDLEVEDLRLRPLDRSVLFPIFRDLEFASLMAQLAEVPRDLRIRDADGLPAYLDLSLTPQGALVALSDREVLRLSEAALREVAGDPQKPKAFFAAKAFYRWGYDTGRPTEGVDFDLHLAAYLLDPGKSRYDLEYLALENLGWKLHSDPEKQRAQEALLVHRLRPKFLQDLESLGLTSLLHDLEIPLARVLAAMEHHGIRVNPDTLTEIERELQIQLRQLEEQIFRLAGEPFNLNSPKQLSRILFEKLGLKPIKRTRTGYSTDQDTLVKLAAQHELPGLILAYRELFKLVSTYLQPLREWISPKDGRIHPTYDQTGAATGRISCKNPNLQNIPIRSEIGRRIREAFEAEPGNLLISADYSQIELRILAHLADDEKLIQAFQEGRDIHAETSQAVFGSPDHRREAKVINYGIAYGMSPYGLSDRLGVPVEEAAAIIDQYFAQFPGVRRWIERTLQEARETGIVRTLLGRIRRVSQLNHPSRQVREMMKRIAINSPIQGTAADMIKLAMIRIHRRLEEENLPAFLVLQIHDELLVEVREDAVDRVKALVAHEMTHALPLKVPVEVDIGVSRTWLEAH